MHDSEPLLFTLRRRRGPAPTAGPFARSALTAVVIQAPGLRTTSQRHSVRIPDLQFVAGAAHRPTLAFDGARTHREQDLALELPLRRRW